MQTKRKPHAVERGAVLGLVASLALLPSSIAVAQSGPWTTCPGGKEVDTGTAFGSPHLAGYSGTLTPELVQAAAFIALTSPEQRPAIDTILRARLQARGTRFNPNEWLALRNHAERGVDRHAPTRTALYRILTGPLGGTYSPTMVPGILRRNETGDVFARGVVEVVTQECVLRPIIDQLIKSPCGTTAGRALYLAARANRDTPRECPAERTTVRLTEVKMAPDSGLKVSLAKGSATPGDVLGFRVLRAATATINRNGTVARAQEVWSGEARIQSDTAMALYAIVARGARLDPDPERPFLLVETTSKPSGGPVSCEQPLQEWKDDHKEPTLNELHGPYKSVAKAMTDDAALPFAYARTHCDVYEWGFAIMRKNTHDRGYYTTPPIRGPEPGTPISAASVPWSDYKRSIDTAFSNSCETVRDFSIAALVHTHPFGVLASDRFTPQDYEHAKELNNGRGTAQEDTWLVRGDFEQYIMANVMTGVVHTFIPANGSEKRYRWFQPICPTFEPLKLFALKLWQMMSR